MGMYVNSSEKMHHFRSYKVFYVLTSIDDNFNDDDYYGDDFDMIFKRIIIL